MTKASYFFFIVLATHVISPSVFLLIALPLMIFRVIVGFHYPIDMLGGFLTGSLAWFVTKNLIFPDILVSLIKNIFLWLKI
jgi:membrane-associated phospholipid phosphatase